MDEQEMNFESDFNAEEEFTPDPLAPVGTYTGHVISVSFDPAQQAIVWTIALSDNNAMMSDGKTPIDGSYHFFRNWMPRPGDESIQTPSGRSDKRSAKIGMLKRFQEGMGVFMNTKEEIIKGISEGLWLGIPVYAKIGFNTWEGVTRNQIEKLTRNESAEVITIPDDEDDIPF